MSTNANANEYGREIAFGVGAMVGMAFFAIGIATLVLAMSIGFRRGQTFLPPGLGQVFLIGGGVLLVGGVLARLYRARLSVQHEDKIKLGSAVSILVGIALLLFRFSPESTVSAPFLVSAEDKVMLFALSYGLIAIGLVVLRLTARIVGW